jgi:hypothetical protein
MMLNASTDKAIITPGKMNKWAAVNQNSRESSIILPTKEWVPECLNPESSFLLPRETAL